MTEAAYSPWRELEPSQYEVTIERTTHTAAPLTATCRRLASHGFPVLASRVAAGKTELILDVRAHLRGDWLSHWLAELAGALAEAGYRPVSWGRSWPKRDQTVRILALTGERLNHATIYRALTPLSALQRTDPRFSCRAIPHAQLSPEDLTWADLILILETLPASLTAWKRDHARMRAAGAAVVLDLNDDLRLLPASNRYHRTMEGTLPILEQIARDADLLTAASPVILEHWRDLQPRAAWLPDAEDPGHYAAALTRRPGRPLTIGVQGGDNHAEDWRILADAWRAIGERYSHVHFAIAGYHAPYLTALPLGERLHLIPWQPWHRFASIQATFDIACCPLPTTRFNACKSPIKWQAPAMLGIPAVVSPCVYGSVATHGSTALIADTTDDWICQLSRLIESAAEAEQIGQAAKAWVEENRVADRIAHRWADAYLEIVNRRR